MFKTKIFGANAAKLAISCLVLEPTLHLRDKIFVQSFFKNNFLTFNPGCIQQRR